MSLDKYVYLRHLKQHTEHFPHQKVPFCSQLPHSLWDFQPYQLVLSILELHISGIVQNMLFFQPYQLVLSVLELHINGTVQNMLFSYLFLSFNMFLTSSHSVLAIPSPRLLSSIPLYKYTASYLFTS